MVFCCYYTPVIFPFDRVLNSTIAPPLTKMAGCIQPSELQFVVIRPVRSVRSFIPRSIRYPLMHNIMKAKAYIASAFTACMIGWAGTPAVAGTPEREIKINQENFQKLSEAEQQRVLEIKERLEAIYNTDRSALNKEERKELRSELKELKEEVNVINSQQPVLYISLSALLIIILLIILL